MPVKGFVIHVISRKYNAQEIEIRLGLDKFNSSEPINLFDFLLNGTPITSDKVETQNYPMFPKIQRKETLMVQNKKHKRMYVRMILIIRFLHQLHHECIFVE